MTPFIFGGGVGGEVVNPVTYDIPYSISLNSPGAEGLSRTITGGSESGTKWSMSVWFKKGLLISAAYHHIFASDPGGNPTRLGIGRSGTNEYRIFATLDDAYQLVTDQLFRDPAAWYHILWYVDTTKTAPQDRMGLYLNGEKITVLATASYPTLNYSSCMGTEDSQYIGSRVGGEYFDGYLAEFIYLDGDPKGPEYFGEFSATTGQWIPKEYTGSYSGKSCKLNFSNSAALGQDSSGLGNNFSITGITSNNQYADSPTKNACVLNLLDKSNNYTLSRGNTIGTIANGVSGAVRATFGVESGKFYWEIKYSAQVGAFGVGNSSMPLTTYVGGSGDGSIGYASSGSVLKNGIVLTSATPWTVGGVVGITYDASTREISFYLDNVLQYSTIANTPSGVLYPAIGSGGGGAVSHTVNFGQRPFTYTPPSGFLPLTANNLSTPAIVKPKNYMDVATYTGNGKSLLVRDTYGTPVAPSYDIPYSLMLNKAQSQCLGRDIITASNRSLWTFSCWYKRADVSGSIAQTLVGAGLNNDTSNRRYDQFYITTTNNNISFNIYNSGTVALKTSTLSLTDPTRSYHLQMIYDSNNATAEDRVRIYVDGVRITSFSTNTNPPLGSLSYTNSAGIIRRVGALYWNNGTTNVTQNYCDGEFSEINFVDGQGLGPSTFGQTNAYGEWVPKEYMGAYGTNGYHFTFDDSSRLGKDASGTTADWTLNGSITSANQFEDTPTENYATWNPLDKAASLTLSRGNTVATSSGAAHYGARATFPIPSTGKWYWECTNTTLTSGSVSIEFGFCLNSIAVPGNAIGIVGAWCLGGSGVFVTNGTNTTPNPSNVSAGEVLHIAFDADNNRAWIGRGGNWYESTATSYTGDPAAGTNPTWNNLPNGVLVPWIDVYANSGTVNFGQRPFVYTPPTGFKALNSKNLSPYPGNTYDFIEIKSRSGTTDWCYMDSVKGIDKYLSPNAPAVIVTNPNIITGLTDAGIVVGSDTKSNTLSATYLAAMYDESVTAGFDIVHVIRTVSAPTSEAFNHNLGVLPARIIAKNTSTTGSFWMYHIGAGYTGCFQCNATTALQTGAGYTWSATSTTATIAVGTAGEYMIAYVWAEVPGFSKFGNYVGNASTDGPFINCGFRPKYIEIKASSAAGNFVIFDSVRGFNGTNRYSLHNTNAIEATTNQIDILSNGFKIRNAAADMNANTVTYVYSAFAEAPFKYSNAR